VACVLTQATWFIADRDELAAWAAPDA